MKIAFVYDPIYPYVIGGAEKRYREFARELAARGHDVSLVGMKYWQGADTLVENGVKLVGVCRAVPLYGKKGTRSVFEAVYFGVNVLLHLLKNSYDVIDCCSFPYFSALACRAAIALRGKKACGKFVITWLEVWGGDYWKKYSGAIWFAGCFLEKYVSSLTGNNIAISGFTAERMSLELGVSKAAIRIIPCGIDLKELKSVSSRGKIDQLIYVGRLISHKKVETLISAFAGVVSESPRFPGLKLRILGKGPSERQCRELAASLGIADRIVFSGFVDEKELYGEIARSRIFVLPSEREGLGIVVVEAMALGTPVAALETEFSAVKNIISDGADGVLFRDVEGLKNSIIKYLADPAFYSKIVKAGFETAARYDTATVTAPELEEYYKNADAVC